MIVLAVLLTSALAAALPTRQPALVTEANNGRSRTVDSHRQGPSPDLPISDPRLAPRGGVEQVHVTIGAFGLIVEGRWSVFVSWSTNGTALPEASMVKYMEASDLGAVKQGNAVWMTATGPPGSVYSTLQDPPPWATPGPATGCGPFKYTDPSCYYTSGALHTTELVDLKPAMRYVYRVVGDTRQWSFSTPPAPGAAHASFGVVGDLGQTQNSSKTVENMLNALHEGQIGQVLFPGDLSYADGDGVRWDTFARLGEPLWATVATAHIGGNHEFSSGGENWVHYRARYPNFQATQAGAHLASKGSGSFLWYSYETGPAHVVMLCSYAASHAGSSQYAWLQRDLASVDRAVTPWLIVVMHTPFYTSNAHHPMSEGAAMRAAIEPLLLGASVDLVFSGHVHAYERTYRVANGALSAAGPAYITIGDGGNREAFAYPWLKDQPEWSALREYAYGFGKLDVNRTHAVFTWLRNDDPWNPSPGPVGDLVVYESTHAARGRRGGPSTATS